MPKGKDLVNLTVQRITVKAQRPSMARLLNSCSTVQTGCQLEFVNHHLEGFHSQKLKRATMDTATVDLSELFCIRNGTSLPQPSTMKDLVSYANGLLDYAMANGIDKSDIKEVVSKSCSTWTPQQRADLLELASAFGELVEDVLDHAANALRQGRDAARQCRSVFTRVATDRF